MPALQADSAARVLWTLGNLLTDSAPSSVGPADPAIIDDLVAASRILARHGVLDAWGHVSIRHPGNPERYLLSRARAAALVIADDIMEFDLDSNPVDQRGQRMFLERFIHGQAYLARPDVNAVVHSHSPTIIPFSVTGEPMKAISHIASFLAKEVPVWEIRDIGITQGLLVTDNKQARSLAMTLGSGPVALMRGHGNVVVASDIKRAVHRALYTEINAQQLATALSFKRPITFIAPDEAQDPKRLDDAWEVWKSEAMRNG
jgi:ribulose-5-phosphate 4-epimerase/fuculose-1-phosphate aldolase